MPKIGEKPASIDAWSYTNLDGSNSSQVLATWKQQVSKHVSYSAAVGPMTNFKDNCGIVFEGKANYKPISNINLQLREKAVLSDKANTVQFRGAAEFSQGLGHGASVYITPYAAAKLSGKDGKLSFDNGIFGGIKYNFNNQITTSIEVQRYNLIGGSNTRENWGVNAGISITI